MRPICDDHPDSDRPLTDATFKSILESYLASYRPGWDVLRGARGVFKEPHSARNDNGLAMSTMNVRSYLHRAKRPPGARLSPIAYRFPTRGPANRMGAVLICEKEGFDELLIAEQVPERYDLALMSTKGISAIAARDLVRGLCVPAFTLHDMDKNGFVMAAGFPFATDIGIRMRDVEEWNLQPEGQWHPNPAKARQNLRRNGASREEAEFIADGQRVELNMLSGPEFIEFVEGKLREHGVEKVIPDDGTLEAAWKRAHAAIRVNRLIYSTWDDNGARESPRASDDTPAPMPDDIRDRIRDELEDDPTQSWDAALWSMCGGSTDDDEDDND